jgi:protein-S-isoprenylcysteine O-methyltransferase Ste14
MYLGFLVALIGVAAAVGSLAAVVAPVGFWAAAQFWYIPFEERRMAARFGADYDRYRARVGRWVTLAPPRAT